MKEKTTIKRYQQSLADQLIKHKSELLQYMREEWDETQKQAKKEKVVREVKEGAYTIGKMLLKLLAIGGICVTAMVAPNVFVVYDKLGKRKYFANEKNIRQEIHYYKRLNYLTFEKTREGEYIMRITDKGLRKVLEKGFTAIRQRNSKWDGWWRIVMFDIPESKKRERDGFRERLRHLGFHQVQKSVFISPYSCDKELEFLLSVFNVGHCVTQLKAKDLEQEEEWRKYFQV